MEESLFSSASGDWCTPTDLLEKIYEFDHILLDPCSNEHSQVEADLKYTAVENGLSQPWNAPGLIYCNPPYGRAIKSWTAKIAQEALLGAEIIALLPARTDTKWFQDLLSLTNPTVLFLEGRLRFTRNGTDKWAAPFPSVLIYLGKRNQKFYNVFKNSGIILRKP